MGCPMGSMIWWFESLFDHLDLYLVLVGWPLA